MKNLSLETIRENGVLQEINRLLLHPVGLEMRMYETEDAGENEYITCIGMLEEGDTPNFEGGYYDVVFKAELFKTRQFDPEQNLVNKFNELLKACDSDIEQENVEDLI